MRTSSWRSTALRRGRTQGPRAGRHRRRDELVGHGVHVELVRARPADRPLRHVPPSRSGTAIWPRRTTGSSGACDSRATCLHSYQGGEACETDDDCAYADGGAQRRHAACVQPRPGLTQRCVPNPQTPATKLCSSFDDDLADHAKRGGDYQPLTYRFCSDERADTTLAWCNRFDEGADYREIVRNVTEDYERMYPFCCVPPLPQGLHDFELWQRVARAPLERAAEHLPEHDVRVHVRPGLPRADRRVRLLRPVPCHDRHPELLRAHPGAAEHRRLRLQHADRYLPSSVDPSGPNVDLTSRLRARAATSAPTTRRV